MIEWLKPDPGLMTWIFSGFGIVFVAMMILWGCLKKVLYRNIGLMLLSTIIDGYTPENWKPLIWMFGCVFLFGQFLIYGSKIWRPEEQ